MGPPAEKPRRATYADLEAVPPNKAAELIRGTLYVFPWPAIRNARVCSALGGLLGAVDKDGPGGWWLLDKPEVHFPDPTAPNAIDALVPDLAGWRRERMPKMPDVTAFTLAPEWICEVLSEATEDFDRDEKMPVYAREGVRHAWLVDPGAKTLEVYTLDAQGRWSQPVRAGGTEVVRAVPFDAIGLDLSALWL